MFYDEFIKLCNTVDKSPTAVAKEMGLAGAHVTKWKNGSKPTDSTLFKICDYFELPHDYFSENKKTPTLTAKDERSDNSVNIIKMAGRDGSYTEKRVSDEQLALFKSMLDQMKPVDDDV